MLENEPLECIQSIKFEINRCAHWRAKIAARYPSDAARNNRAAECLAQLATGPTELSETAWLQLQPHFDWGSESWREAISQTARLVEFKRNITTLPGVGTNTSLTYFMEDIGSAGPSPDRTAGFRKRNHNRFRRTRYRNQQSFPEHFWRHQWRQRVVFRGLLYTVPAGQQHQLFSQWNVYVSDR
jgi:hypothetical protein